MPRSNSPNELIQLKISELNVPAVLTSARVNCSYFTQFRNNPY